MTTKFRCLIPNNKRAKIAGLVALLICALCIISCDVRQVSPANDGVRREPEEVYITLEGGTGKASIQSPAEVIYKDGKTYVTLVWNSKNYDYMIAGGIRYENEAPGENSTFTIPVDSFDEPLDVIGDTVAMSKPHEIEYRIIWSIAAGEAADDPDGEIPGGDREEETDRTGSFGSRTHEWEEPVIGGIKPTGKADISYAEGFDIYEYGDCSLIRIYGVGDHLIVPEGKEIPDDIPEGITVIRKPCDVTYLVSTSVADLVRSIGALDMVKLVSLRENEWHIDEVVSRMKDKEMIYAGKYRTPDYELILSSGCDLAIENTMIYHDPEVKEKLEELGIPVIVETSSYEKDILGRLEWVKLYGALFDRTAEAEEFFASQEEKIGKLETGTPSGKKAAVFYVSSTGNVNVRAPGDYLSGMIEAAGATYVPDDTSSLSGAGMGTVSMQMEDFYLAASDADILIYNSAIEDELTSLDDLIAIDPLFSQFKAVQSGSVYCLGSDFFQKSAGTADLLTDLVDVMEGGEGPYTFLSKLN